VIFSLVTRITTALSPADHWIYWNRALEELNFSLPDISYRIGSARYLLAQPSFLSKIITPGYGDDLLHARFIRCISICDC
jgi:hypothetical protein